VIVQVFVGNVGDHANVIITGCHPVLGQPVRGGLQNDMGETGSNHLRQVTLHIRRFGRGHVKAGIQGGIANDGIDGGDHAGADSRSLHNLVDQVGGGSLAIGTGDANDGKLPGREAVKCRCQVSQGEAVIGYLEIRNAEVGKLGGGAGARSGCRAALNGRWNVTVTIHTAADKRHKQAARDSHPRIQHHAGNFRVG